jgi:hypothetical protein
MGKKQVAVSLRKPPPADPDAFVAAAQKTESAPAARSQVAEGAVVSTRAGERREVTVYLPPDLARRLSVRCLELDRDVSNVVAEALAEALAAEGPAAKPSDVWARARALLADLRARLPAALRLA